MKTVPEICKQCCYYDEKAVCLDCPVSPDGKPPDWNQPEVVGLETE
jgi:hypothetical protein